MSTRDSSIVVSPNLKRRQIWATSVILVPYSRHHVPKYNQWMQSEELQFLTGSEPLNLEEEFEMYQSWTDDANKCTFIVLDRSKYESLPDSMPDQDREVEAMVGDVNFYVLDSVEAVAEIEIMIAEVGARGRGFGREAALVMMKFGHEMVNIARYEAKIKMSNVKSQRLFVEYFGFAECSRSEVFEEITYESDLTPDGTLKRLFSQCQAEHRPFEDQIMKQ